VRLERLETSHRGRLRVALFPEEKGKPGRSRPWHEACDVENAMINNLTELYYDQLRDLYSAETQMIQNLPGMVQAATDQRLKEAFSSHLEETRKQKSRLEQICSRHGISPVGEECQAMNGLAKEAKSDAEKTLPGSVRDAVLIAAANRIEHYEIAGYGVARAFADCLEFSDDVDQLTETLDEEGAADRTITEIATGSLFRHGVNEAAVR